MAKLYGGVFSGWQAPGGIFFIIFLFNTIIDIFPDLLKLF